MIVWWILSVMTTQCSSTNKHVHLAWPNRPLYNRTSGYQSPSCQGVTLCSETVRKICLRVVVKTCARAHLSARACAVNPSVLITVIRKLISGFSEWLQVLWVCWVPSPHSFFSFFPPSFFHLVSLSLHLPSPCPPHPPPFNSHPPFFLPEHK